MNDPIQPSGLPLSDPPAPSPLPVPPPLPRVAPPPPPVWSAPTEKPPADGPMSPTEAARQAMAVRDEIRRAVFGQEEVLEAMLVALLAGGHALLEGVPGTAKTLMVRALARALGCTTRRTQFTPDLMPSDIIGTNVFELATQQFNLRKGPVFTDLLLADEINRAPAKTQSALLEALAEGQTTIDGERHELSPVFTVYATQNPVEFEGTYPLPEAQQDRFLLKIRVPYPEPAAERRLLDVVASGRPLSDLGDGAVRPVLDREKLLAVRSGLAGVRVEDGVVDYILRLVRATREDERILLGAGPRGGMALLAASRARAALNGRDFVIPDDVAALAEPALGHRIQLSAESEVQGIAPAEVVASILDMVEVPR